MTRQLHPCARTDAAIQNEIQESSETTKAKPTGLVAAVIAFDDKF